MKKVSLKYKYREEKVSSETLKYKYREEKVSSETLKYKYRYREEDKEQEIDNKIGDRISGVVDGIGIFY